MSSFTPPANPNRSTVLRTSSGSTIKLRTGFPDLRVTIDDIFGLGDKVTVRFTARGTHLGQYRGLPPTGVRMTVTEICIYRLANGKVQELWQELNALGVMQQLGVVPRKGSVRSAC